jgi:hypothetical protein
MPRPKVDEDILRCFFRLEEYQTQRLRFERMLHPESFNWAKKGAPPPISDTKKIRLEELAEVGFGEDFYKRMTEGEEAAEKELKELMEMHALWPYLEPVRGFGLLLAGKFVAAGGDIQKPETVSGFWKGMGLDIVDGVAPRRVRGRKDVERRIPALPFVTRVGEQIRQQLLKQNPFYQQLYYQHKEDYHVRYPDKAKMFCHKHGLRIAQKVLYAGLWKEWRESYHLPAPLPYVFEILKHDDGHIISIQDFWTKTE